MCLHSTNTPAYARRHPVHRSWFVDSEVDVPATFLGAREPHVTRTSSTSGPRAYARARMAAIRPSPSPKRPHMLGAARGRGLPRGRCRARDARYQRARSAVEAGSEGDVVSNLFGRLGAEQKTRHHVGAGDRTQTQRKREAPSAPGRTRQTRVVLTRSHRRVARHGALDR
jgi:hypothetical protein